MAEATVTVKLTPAELRAVNLSLDEARKVYEGRRIHSDGTDRRHWMQRDAEVAEIQRKL